MINSLNSRRENNIAILEADLSIKVSYFAKLAMFIFLIALSFYKKHVHKKHEAEIRQKLKSRQAGSNNDFKEMFLQVIVL